MGRSTDFSNCYIYHILDKEKVVHYVGSTSNLNSRKSAHKYRCNTEHDKNYQLDIYQYIRDNGGFDAFEIVPIQKIENISNKTELLIAEQTEMNKFSNLKNKNGSYRGSRKEINKIYYEKNKDQINQQNRQWKTNNREKVKKYQRQYREQKKQLNASDQ
jgi:hypothetical protein